MEEEKPTLDEKQVIKDEQVLQEKPKTKSQKKRARKKSKQEQILKRMKSKLNILNHAMSLCSYLYKLTEDSPKNFRYDIIKQIRNTSLDIIYKIQEANSVAYVTDTEVKGNVKLRLQLQKEVVSLTTILSNFLLIANTVGCIDLDSMISAGEQVLKVHDEIQNWNEKDENRVLINIPKTL
jgi:hypothetical protein